MLIERIEIRLLDLPLRKPFVAAHGSTVNREIVVVRIDGADGQGWGECSALPEPTYTDEFAAGAYDILDEELAPRLLGHRLTASAVRARLSLVRGNPMAKAALEMALLDAELKAEGRSLASWLGVTETQVKAGAAIGLAPPDEVADRAASLADDGFQRVKLKIMPGHDIDVVAAVNDRVPEIEVQVDANGSYGSHHLEELSRLCHAGISAIEQPFAVDAPALAAKLGERSAVPIVADEAATSLVAVDRLRAAQAAGGISIKPPRLGGILAARELHDACVGWGLAATAGGMVESGLGRHALAAISALPGFTLVGDVSPAGRWLSSDPWTDLAMTDGYIEVPSEAGIAPEPDGEALDRHTIKSSLLEA